MELTQLYQFKTVAECGQIKKAADLLFVTPPALSKSIKKLEEELGCELFDRSKSGFELNDTGKDILEDINGIFALTNKIKEKVKSSNDNGAKTITVASSVPSSIRYLTPLFCADNQDVEMISYFMERDKLISAIDSGEIDLAITTDYTKRGDLFVVPFCQERNFLFVPARNPLSKKTSVTVSELGGQTIAKIDEYSHFYEVFDRLCAETGTKVYFKVFRDYTTFNTFKERSNDLICLFTGNNLSTMYNNPYPGRSIVYFAEKELTYTYYFTFKKDNYKTVEPFMVWLRENYRSLLM